MPFTLSTLISGPANRFSSRPPTSSSGQPNLYFPPGGHTHDRHTIPPDRLHISLSDPVLVAAEQTLYNHPNGQRGNKLSIIKDSSARQIAHLRSVVFHLKGGIHSQRSGDYNDGPLAAQAVNPLTTPTSAPSPDHSWKVGFQGAVAQGLSLLDLSDDSHDFMGVIDGSPGNADSSASDNRYTLTNKLRFPRPDQ
jgi:hypothetical protein